MHPRHLVFATGVSSIPSCPTCPASPTSPAPSCIPATSSSAEAWKGRKALVLGSGTSGHDVAQELPRRAPTSRIIQRSKTHVVSLKEAQRVYAIYSEGIPFDDCDLLATSLPYPVLRRSYQLSTAKGLEVDKDLLDALAARGFRLWAGEDETGFQMMYLRHGGGYYFNVGCSELIISGADQASAICRHRPLCRRRRAAQRRRDRSGRAFGAGDRLPEPAGSGAALSRRRGRRQDRPGLGLRRRRRVAQHVAGTAQPGLWFIAGCLAQCRIFSRYLAIQIKALEEGLLNWRAHDGAKRVPVGTHRGRRAWRPARHWPRVIAIRRRNRSGWPVLRKTVGFGLSKGAPP